MKIAASVIVMTKNEEANIGHCLKSVAGFEEIFVVDSGSTDQTISIAEKMGARVIEFHWNGRYPKKKQWCLENLPFSYDWVLFVDADEVVTSRCFNEIAKLLQGSSDFAGYFVGYDYVFMGKVLHHGLKVYKLILFQRKKAQFLEYDDLAVNHMWEVEGHYQPLVNGKVGKLTTSMLHCDHDNLFSFFEKLNRYSDWEAYLRNHRSLSNPASTRLKSRAFLQNLRDKLPLNWVAVFIYSYFLKLGFLDGGAGFYFAVVMAVYYAMITMKSQEPRMQCKEG
jgi:glycosyltransferase involved in cell wall biosynthesis